MPDEHPLQRPVVMALIGLPFIAAGIWLSSHAYTAWSNYSTAKSWVPVDATVLDSVIQTRQGGGWGHGEQPSHRLFCRYRYTVDDKEYTSTRAEILGGFSIRTKTLRKRQDLLRRHQNSKKPFTAYVNPRDHSQAVLFREPGPTMYFVLLGGLLFLAAGTGVSGFGVARIVMFVREQRAKGRG